MAAITPLSRSCTELGCFWNLLHHLARFSGRGVRVRAQKLPGHKASPLAQQPKTVNSTPTQAIPHVQTPSPVDPCLQQSIHLAMASHKPLNPAAAEFVPGSLTESWVSSEECSEVSPTRIGPGEAGDGWCPEKGRLRVAHGPAPGAAKGRV